MTADALRTWLVSGGAVAAYLGKATVLLALAWAADLALRRANPRCRVLLWRGTALGLAALPLLMLALPALRVEVAAQPPPAATAAVPTHAAPLVLDASRAAVSFERARPWLPAAVWAAGLLLSAARTVVGHRLVRRMVRASRPLPRGAARFCHATAEALGCGGAARFRAADALGSPLLAGLLRPVVLLPARLVREASEPDLRGIVAHELGHLRSHDPAWAYALHWVAAALWFHPLAWRMRRAHGRACELVSDAASAAHVGSGRAYARTLARVAVGMGALRPMPAGLPLAGRSEIGGRLAALRRGIGARRLPVAWLVAACLLAAVLTAALSALVFTRASSAATVRTRVRPGLGRSGQGDGPGGDSRAPLSRQPRGRPHGHDIRPVRGARAERPGRPRVPLGRFLPGRLPRLGGPGPAGDSERALARRHAPGARAGGAEVRH